MLKATLLCMAALTIVGHISHNADAIVQWLLILAIMHIWLLVLVFRQPAERLWAHLWVCNSLILLGCLTVSAAAFASTLELGSKPNHALFLASAVFCVSWLDLEAHLYLKTHPAPQLDYLEPR